MRKGRYVFKLNRQMTTEEIWPVIKENWNEKRYNKPRKGMLWKTDYEEFIILPGTYQHVVIMYTGRKKLIMSSAWPKTNLPKQLANTVTYSSEFYPIIKASEGLPAGPDRMGPLKNAMSIYADEVARIIKENGLGV